MTTSEQTQKQTIDSMVQDALESNFKTFDPSDNITDGEGMICDLTQEQLDEMPKYVDKWVSIGLSTDLIDFEKAKEAIHLAYAAAGLESIPDENIIHCQGPRDATKKIQELSGDPSLNASSAVFFVGSSASELAKIEYCENVLNIKGLRDIEGVSALEGLARNAGWINMFDTHAFVSERPCLIKRDRDHQLHCEDGPAIEYRDGYKVFFWHGNAVPEHWIIDQPTVKDIFDTANQEVRAAGIEILGWETILETINCKVIDVDDDPEIGTLVHGNIPGIDEICAFVRVQCGTGRKFALRVPPTVTTALEGVSWTYGYTPEEYKLEVRT